jgi:hypothetical protein
VGGTGSGNTPALLRWETGQAAGRHYYCTIDFDKPVEKFGSLAEILKAKQGDYVWEFRDVTG